MEETKRIDFLLLAVTMMLAGIGLTMVFSSSMYNSLDQFGSSTHYFWKQARHILIGFVLMIGIARLNYRGFAVVRKGILWFGFVLLAALLLENFIKGYSVNRWLHIGPIGFQPSELMKIFLVIFLAGSIEEMGEKIRDFQGGFLPLMGTITAAFVLVFLQPDLGIAGILLATGLYVLFIGRAKLLHLLMVTGPAAAVVAIGITIVPYMKRRWEGFLSPEMGYQIKQSIIGIGSGGIFGVGLGNSAQKYYFLPERHTDFVFSIFAEELGFFGSALLLGLTIAYILRGLKIAGRAPDMFGFLTASGLTMIFAMQVFINIGVAIRILPTTGMTLPFISYGGSSIVVSFIVTGILLSISRQGNYVMSMSREFGNRSWRKAWE